jgi:hypothetical protein
MKAIALIATIAGATMLLIPVAQAQSGFDGSPDAVDRAVAAKQAQDAAAFDAREHAQLAIQTPMPDVVERTVRAHQLSTGPDLSGMPDVLTRTAAAGQLQYSQTPTSTSGFDWQDFGLGAGAGGGIVLLLGGLGIGLWLGRHGQRQVSSA